MYKDTKEKRCNVCGRFILDYQTVCNDCINWHDGIVAEHSFKVYKSLRCVNACIDDFYPALNFLKKARETITDKKTKLTIGSISRLSYVLDKAQREIVNLLY